MTWTDSAMPPATRRRHPTMAQQPKGAPMRWELEAFLHATEDGIESGEPATQGWLPLRELGGQINPRAAVIHGAFSGQFPAQKP
jgi:hypothetical protein